MCPYTKPCSFCQQFLNFLPWSFHPESNALSSNPRVTVLVAISCFSSSIASISVHLMLYFHQDQSLKNWTYYPADCLICLISLISIVISRYHPFTLIFFWLWYFLSPKLFSSELNPFCLFTRVFNIWYFKRTVHTHIESDGFRFRIRYQTKQMQRIPILDEVPTKHIKTFTKLLLRL